jgi:exosortase/archaeosortase family protein
MTVPREPAEAPPASGLAKAVRWLVAIGIWSAMAAGIVCAAKGRTIEARIAADLVGSVTRGHTGTVGDVILAGMGTRRPMGLQITNECTVLLLIVPMLFTAGLITLFRRFRVPRVLLGLLAGVVIVGVTNQLRILLIAWATQRYGLGVGYEVTHKFVGSVLALLGFAVGLLAMLKIAPGRRVGGRS